ncbi:hypothetical protein B0A55_02117 [Friedmanniomyces simplex]|uniref:Carboxylic ester hydrolase n=1 Tax=Friedmanniomyces simplex TaxID=329884 RepID=A0A4U0XRK6_9PEZI|nr:hypothetical protein B0A55_02117 [Friedmanniomyces simplex]
MRTVYTTALALAIWTILTAARLHDYAECSDLARLPLPGVQAKIDFAEAVASGSNFTGNTSEPSYNIPQTDLPASCRVSFTVSTSSNSSAGAEVWLPTAWTGRYLSVGNGGFAGAVNYPDLVWGLRKGFAVMSTDTGHLSSQSDGSWLSNPQQAIDWGHRALHVTTTAAKEIVSAYYEQDIGHSYYAGCSTGGRQGLNAAQHYPDDFEGVLVGSAIPWQTHTSAWQTYVALEQYPSNASSYIPPTMWAVIHEAVLVQCDALDGITDGIIMNPARCNFQAEVLLCGMPTVNASACLNTAQLQNLKRMYRPWLTSTGELVNPGIAHSGEASFSFIMNQPQPQFGPIFYGYAVVNDSDWNWEEISVATVSLADSINPGGANAYNPDMRPFQDAGGKLIHYHGYSDPLIPTYNAPAWYDKLVDLYSEIGRGGEVPAWYRLFTVPGMGHCAGGVGAWVVDGASQGVVPAREDSAHSMLWSLVEWVEGKKNQTGGAVAAAAAPESVIGTKFVNDTPAAGVAFERPVCRWPNVAEYVGGQASSPASWRCPVAGVY